MAKGTDMQNSRRIVLGVVLSLSLGMAACSTAALVTPSDEPVRLGKEYFARKDYGLAEQNFRAAVEANPDSVDAWVGLAASYDELRRFDLADKAYVQAVRLAGETPEILNNRGYHFLLRGNLLQARRYLLAAAARDPGNPYVLSNLKLLETWTMGEDSRRCSAC
jgi:Flp pilus assembly protein TadD